MRLDYDHEKNQKKDVFLFFSSRRRHTRFDCDWSSDVCSSDLKKGSDCSEPLYLSCLRGLDSCKCADSALVCGSALDSGSQCGHDLEVHHESTFCFPLDNSQILTDCQVYNVSAHSNHNCGSCRQPVTRPNIFNTLDSLDTVEDLISGTVREEIAELVVLSRRDVDHVWSEEPVAFQHTDTVDDIRLRVSCSSPIAASLSVQVRSVEIGRA